MTDEEIWNKTPGSDNRMNNMTNMKNTGTYLEGLDKSKHGIWICTEDGASLLKDHVYLCNAAGDDVIDLSAVSDHMHTRTAGDGGDFLKFYSGTNSDVFILSLTKTQDLAKANWNQTVTGTGSIEDDIDGTTGERSIKLRPNGTSGSGSTISYPHLKCRWDRYFLYETKLRIDTASSLALHTGIGADDITAADSNARKVQAEVCTVTNNNWWLRTADNTANSSSDTGVAISTSRVAVSIEHDPQAGTPTTNIWIDNTILTKTTNIPTSNTTASDNLIKHSIKNSTAADRPMFTYGSRLAYRVNDSWGYI